MGSKNIGVDGAISVFRIVKESVDALRRQVEKCLPTIALDFYEAKEELEETNFMLEIGYNPFLEKDAHLHSNGLALEGIKV